MPRKPTVYECLASTLRWVIGPRCVAMLRVSEVARRLTYRLVLILLWTLSSSALEQPGLAQTSSAESAPLTNALQVLSLPKQDLKNRPPVQIRGMVTFYEQGMALFVQDQTAGVFVYHTKEPLGLKPGQYVEVTGFANRGRYSAIIDSPQLRILANGPSIVPRPVALSEIYQGGLDAQWVEVTGVLRNAKPAGGGIKLELVVGSHRLNAWIPHCDTNDAGKLQGMVATLRGVVGTRVTDDNQLVGFQLFVNSLLDVRKVKERESARLPSTVTPIEGLKEPGLRMDGIGLVRVSGIVTLHWPGLALFIQDSSGAVEIRLQDDPGQVSPGTVVDAVGYLGPALEPSVLEDATIRIRDTNQWIQPASATAEDLFSGRYEYKLVATEAIFMDWISAASNSPALAFHSEGRALTAVLDSSARRMELSWLKPGARVKLCGVFSLRREPALMEPSARLLLRSVKDLTLIEVAESQKIGPWGISKIGAILAAAALVVTLWYSQRQRKQILHVLQLQTSLQAEMRQGEHQLRRAMDEREKIGRDLHDDIIQSIYAVGLNLEDCRRVVRESPQQAENRIGSAIHMLNSTIRSVRGFLTGLEPKVLNGREFKTALKSLALTSGDGPMPVQIEVHPSAANSLTSSQATQLLHIAKEAMSNSLRHAHAANLVVALQPVSFGVQLEVRDNGQGFDLEKTPGSGLGLRNMSARAREIGAELQILSAPGQGCRIVATVPQPSSNEHL
jgi:signal transduction histidine kinase